MGFCGGKIEVEFLNKKYTKLFVKDKRYDILYIEMAFAAKRGKLHGSF